MSNFQETLARGLHFENTIAQWLLTKNYCISPAYEKVENNHKGPRLLIPGKELVLPDMMIMQPQLPQASTSEGFALQESILQESILPQVCWVEAKSKSVFTWYRKFSCWESGIDTYYLNQYTQVQEATGLPVWIIWYQEAGKTSQYNPEGRTSPSGMYGQSLSYLLEHISHQYQGKNDYSHGGEGMTYWNIKDLQILEEKI
jgi:hypothetical protein